MKIPSLRRPVGASVLAGICGAGLLDLLLTAGQMPSVIVGPSVHSFFLLDGMKLLILSIILSLGDFSAF